MQAQAFTIPSRDAVLIWRKYWILGVMGTAVPALLNTNGLFYRLFLFVGSSFLVGAVMFFIYYRSTHDKWITLSEGGIDGRSQSTSMTHVDWNEAVVIEEKAYGVFPGVVLCRTHESDAHLFVPAAILKQEEFKMAVAALSPPAHPLRTFLANAT